MPLNFLFKFTGINLVLVNIKAVEFHLIRLCSFCNIYMSNDVKFFETPCILTLRHKNAVYRYSYKYLKFLLKIQWIFVILLSFLS